MTLEAGSSVNCAKGKTMNADKSIQLLNKRIHWMNRVNEVLTGLYGNSDKKYLYQSAEVTARVIFQCLVHELVMSISRLLDPPETCGRENLCIGKVHELIRQEGFEIGKLGQIRMKMDAAFKPIKKARDKIIAHHDFETWELQDRVKYEGVNKNSVDVLIGLVIEYINTANELVRNTTMKWDPINPSRGGPKVLLEKLGLNSKNMKNSNDHH